MLSTIFQFRSHATGLRLERRERIYIPRVTIPRLTITRVTIPRVTIPRITILRITITRVTITESPSPGSPSPGSSSPGSPSPGSPSPGSPSPGSPSPGSPPFSYDMCCWASREGCTSREHLPSDGPDKLHKGLFPHTIQQHQISDLGEPPTGWLPCMVIPQQTLPSPTPPYFISSDQQSPPTGLLVSLQQEVHEPKHLLHHSVLAEVISALRGRGQHTLQRDT